MTKQEALREYAIHLATQEFGSGYRGYLFAGMKWDKDEENKNRFSITAFMLNSPLHPMDAMYVCEDGIEMLPSSIECVVKESIGRLRSLIDQAYADPSRFVPTRAEIR